MKAPLTCTKTKWSLVFLVLGVALLEPFRLGLLALLDIATCSMVYALRFDLGWAS